LSSRKWPESIGALRSLRSSSSERSLQSAGKLRGRLDRAWSGDIPTWIISGEAEFANSIAHQAELDRAFDLALDVLQNGGSWGRLGGPSSHLRAEIPKLAADQHRAVPPLSELYVGCSVPVSVLAQFQGAQPEAHGAEIRKRCVRGGNDHNPQTRSTYGCT
jgi:hypothetical protein